MIKRIFLITLIVFVVLPFGNCGYFGEIDNCLDSGMVWDYGDGNCSNQNSRLDVGKIKVSICFLVDLVKILVIVVFLILSTNWVRTQLFRNKE